MKDKKYKCEFTLEDLQTIYYLIEKEMKSTEDNIIHSMYSKDVKLDHYEDMLNKKKSLEKTKKQIRNYYGEIHVK